MSDLKVLVTKVLNGDGKSFEELYELTKKGVYYTCLSFVKSEDDIKDIMQDTYLSAYNKLSTLKEPEKFQSWINQIAANKCRNYLVKPGSISLDEMYDGNIDIKDDELELPDEYIENVEKRKIVMEILKKLPEDQFQTIILYYFDEMTTASIAELMRCPEGTVKYRLVTARTKIKKEVLKYEEKNNYKLHSVVALPFLTLLLLEEAKAQEVPFASINLPTQNMAAPNKLEAAKVVKGDKIMSAAMKKIIVALVSLVAVGGIIAAVVIGINSNNSNEDESSKKKHVTEKNIDDDNDVDKKDDSEPTKAPEESKEPSGEKPGVDEPGEPGNVPGASGSISSWKDLDEKEWLSLILTNSVIYNQETADEVHQSTGYFGKDNIPVNPLASDDTWHIYDESKLDEEIQPKKIKKLDIQVINGFYNVFVGVQNTSDSPMTYRECIENGQYWYSDQTDSWEHSSVEEIVAKYGKPNEVHICKVDKVPGMSTEFAKFFEYSEDDYIEVTSYYAYVWNFGDYDYVLHFSEKINFSKNDLSVVDMESDSKGIAFDYVIPHTFDAKKSGILDYYK